jgi:redox-sensitive transcriptional activator SoxR
MDVHELTPGKLANRSGVAISALHFYEREGLISSRRTSGNQRRYARETLRRVAFIRMSQRLGIPLAKVRQALVRLPTDRVPTSKDWAKLSAGWRRRARRAGPRRGSPVTDAASIPSRSSTSGTRRARLPVEAYRTLVR